MLTNCFSIVLDMPCENGGTGRRARLRGVWCKSYGFKSRFSHQIRVAIMATLYFYSLLMSHGGYID